MIEKRSLFGEEDCRYTWVPLQGISCFAYFLGCAAALCGQ